MAQLHRSEVEFGSSGLEDINRAARALTAIDRQLPRDFKNSINEVARGLRDMARVAALNEPSQGKGHTGLRARVSTGVGIAQIPDGVRIITKMPELDEAIIPRGMDTVKGWRHPVFGHRDRWVVQRSGTDSWFMETMAKGQEPLRERLIRNINDAADKVADSS